MLQKNYLMTMQLNPNFEPIRQNNRTSISKSLIRNVDIAKTLGISEGDLVSSYQLIEFHQESKSLQCFESYLKHHDLPMVSLMLKPDWPLILDALKNFGELMALTRNEACVHEKVGVYQNFHNQGDIGVLLGDIDLRIFYEHWYAGYLLIEHKGGKVIHSLQFYNQYGVAIHKIYLRNNDEPSVIDDFIREFVHEGIQENDLCRVPACIYGKLGLPQGKTLSTPVGFDQKKFRDAWSSMRDTHEFSELLANYRLERIQAFHAIGDEYAKPLELDQLEDVLRMAVDERVPLMIFVGNGAVIQIHTGLIHKINTVGSWLNVMDGTFNMHLRQSLVASVWMVRKPTVDGIVSSIEVFDRHGELIMMIFGQRKPGQLERCDWRQLLDRTAGERIHL